MPEFNCRTLTPQGQVVRSVVEESSRLSCIRKLRRNGLTPISVTPRVTVKLTNGGSNNKKTKNIKSLSNFEVKHEFKKKKTKTAQGGVWGKLTGEFEAGGKKITSRDVRVFTQNFYLLKKANFNNIHALSTVIRNYRKS